MLLAISVALFVAVSSRGQEIIAPRVVSLSVPDKFSEVIFSGQTNLSVVKIVLGTQKQSLPLKHPDTDELGIQMWLLHADGTVISHRGKPGVYWSGSFDSTDTCLSFTFARSATNRPVGIMLRYRGKLYCTEIQEEN